MDAGIIDDVASSVHQITAAFAILIIIVVAIIAVSVAIIVYITVYKRMRRIRSKDLR